MAAVEEPSETLRTGVLTSDALHLALTRCMAAHPPGGIEFQMHPDANVMAGLWGKMNYERTVSVPLERSSHRSWKSFGAGDLTSLGGSPSD